MGRKVGADSKGRMMGIGRKADLGGVRFNHITLYRIRLAFFSVGRLDFWADASPFPLLSHNVEIHCLS